MRVNWNIEGMGGGDIAFSKTLLNLPLIHAFVVFSLISVSPSFKNKGDLQTCEEAVSKHVNRSSVRVLESLDQTLFFSALHSSVVCSQCE